MKNKKLEICEIFESLSGETSSSGLPSLFIRCSKCNLNCSYCDTLYNNEINYRYDIEKLYKIISVSKSKIVIVTGGEPLRSTNHIFWHFLIRKFPNKQFIFETNGTQKIDDFLCYKNVQFIVDYKLPSSRMEKYMDLNIWKNLENKDIIKFVIKNEKDYLKAINLIKKNNPKAEIYFSPVFGEIDLKELWNWVVRDKIGRLQIQLHKIIFDINKRKV